MPPKKTGSSEESAKDNASSGKVDSQLVKLGKYVIEKKVGSGGMGTVYSAIDQDLKRRVALKVLPKDKAENPTLVKRFKAEARSGAQMEHQNIIRVYESGEADGYLYMALEFVDGIDLFKLIQKRGRIPPKRSIEIIKQSCKALDHAYKSNVVHRDIKPSNLMITNDGTVKLADMGLARIIDETQETIITRAGTTVGTVDYMAPEQARSSKEADIRSDIYSLGCTWYHMLTGNVPFPEGSMTNKLHAHATKSPPDPRHIVDTIPASIVAVIQKMMAKKKEDRYQTPAELLEELDNANLKRGEISSNSLEALAQEVDDFDYDKSSASDDADSDERDVPAYKSKSSKSKAKSQQSAEPKSSGKPAKSSSSNNKATEESPTSGKYKKRDKKPEPDEDRNKFHFDIKPLAFITFILVAVGLGYGIITIMKSFGNVLENNDGKFQFPVNQQGNDAENKNKPVVNNDAVPVLNSSADRAMTIDEYLSKKGVPNQVDNTPTAVNPSTFGQEHLGTQEERLSQQLEQYTSHLKGHLETPDPVFKISIGKPQKNIHINEAIFSALIKMPNNGGVIEFTDNGPYIISQTIPIANSRVILTAAPGKSPILVYRPQSSTEPNPMWMVNRGELQLKGIHISLNPKLAESKNIKEIISVNGGMISLVDSSIALQGVAKNPVTAIGLHNTQTSPIVFMARSSIRGNPLKCFDINSRDAKIVISQCLLASGSSPAVMSKGLPGIELQTLHDILLDQSIAVSEKNIFTLENTIAPAKPVRYRIRTQQSLLSAGSKPTNSSMLICNEWIQIKNENQSELKNPYLLWEEKESCLAGWDSLAEFNFPDAKENLKIKNRDEWNKHFFVVEPEEFVTTSSLPDNWHQNPENIQSTVLDQVVRKITMNSSAKDALAKLPLIYPLSLPIEKLKIDELLLSVDDIKQIPPNAQILVCDVTKTDLGEFISRPNLPSPVVIEVRGVGIKQMKPIKISNKTIRLLFPSNNQAGGTSQLIIRPQMNAEAVKSGTAGLIDLDKSQLDIVGGYFQITSSAKDALASWFITAKDSRISLQKTYVEGPLGNNPGHMGLINFNDSTQGNQCFIHDSFLRTSGTCINSQDQLARLSLNKSALVGMDSVLKLKNTPLKKTDKDRIQIAEFNFCTLASNQSILKFDLNKEITNPKPVAVVVNNSIFAPGIINSKIKNEATSLISTSIPINQLPQFISWWGNNNAYAQDLILTTSGNKENELLDNIWPVLWEDEQALKSHFGNDAAFLEKKIDDFLNITPQNLLMHSTSQAAKAGPNATPIGADVLNLEIKKPDTVTAPPKVNPPVKPNNPGQPGRPMF